MPPLDLAHMPENVKTTIIECVKQAYDTAYDGYMDGLSHPLTSPGTLKFLKSESDRLQTALAWARTVIK